MSCAESDSVRALQLVFEGRLVNVCVVAGLDDKRDAHEGCLDRVEGRRVQHLALDVGSVRAPVDQERPSLSGWLIFPRAVNREGKIDEGVAAVVLNLQVG